MARAIGALSFQRDGKAGRAPWVGLHLPSGIQARLALLLVAACLPAVIVFGLYAAYRYEKGQQEAVEELQREAHAIAAVKGVMLEQTQAVLRSLADLPQLRNMQQDPATCAAALARTLAISPQHANFAVADMGGTVVCRGLATAPAKPVSVSDREWFQRVMAQRDFVVGGYAVGRGSGEPSIHTAYPIFDENDRMVGAVNTGIRLDWLNERMGALNLSAGIVVALLDGDGAILARHPHPERYVGLKIPAEAARVIREQVRGTTNIQMLDGVYRTVAFEPLGEGRWGGLTVVAAAEPAYLWAPVGRLIAVQTLNFTAVLLLVLLAAVAGGRSLVVRPVQSLERAVDAYSRGDFTARAEEDHKGELGRLARAFNTMAQTLERHERSLQRSNAQKSRYLTMASHDLRQPLHTVMLGLESGIEGAEGKARAALERSQRAAERLQTQLDDLADVVRADLADEVMQVRIRAVPISDLFRTVDALHRPDAESKGLAFRIVDSSQVVASEPGALLAMVCNLVRNAIAYTASGRVVIGCRRAGSKCRIEVHDTGPGIPPEALARIFDPFLRLQPETAPGLGLGLTIVKATAESLGCEVSVRSAPGKGSSFCVEVPLWNQAPHSP